MLKSRKSSIKYKIHKSCKLYQFSNFLTLYHRIHLNPRIPNLRNRLLGIHRPNRLYRVLYEIYRIGLATNSTLSIGLCAQCPPYEFHNHYWRDSSWHDCGHICTAPSTSASTSRRTELVTRPRLHCWMSSTVFTRRLMTSRSPS